MLQWNPVSPTRSKSTLFLQEKENYLKIEHFNDNSCGRERNEFVPYISCTDIVVFRMGDKCLQNTLL